MLDWYVIIPESRPVGRFVIAAHMCSLFSVYLSLSSKKGSQLFSSYQRDRLHGPRCSIQSQSASRFQKENTTDFPNCHDLFFFGANDDPRSIFLTEYRPGIKKSVTLQHGQESENDVQSRDGKDKPIIHPN